MVFLTTMGLFVKAEVVLCRRYTRTPIAIRATRKRIKTPNPINRDGWEWLDAFIFGEIVGESVGSSFKEKRSSSSVVPQWTSLNGTISFHLYSSRYHCPDWTVDLHFTPSWSENRFTSLIRTNESISSPMDSRNESKELRMNIRKRQNVWKMRKSSSNGSLSV